MTKILSNAQAEELKSKLLQNGYSPFFQNNKYVVWSVKKDKITITYYSSKKLYINGNEDDVFRILSEKYESTIGADESGKGDYFGPLVICAAYLPSSEYKKAYKLNVRDSKTINDESIVKIFKSLNFDYEIKILSPIDYNKKIEELKNLNILLTNSYIKIINKLKKRTNCKRIFIDAYIDTSRIKKSFPYPIIAASRAEEKEIAVALASVIARYHFIKELSKLSDKYKIQFPKGSTNVIEFGKKFVSAFGTEELKKVAKIHFSLTSKIVK